MVLPPVKRKFKAYENLEKIIGILQLEKGQLEAVVREKNLIIENPRNFLAEHFIQGQGIEIGAAQLPVKLPVGASVKYVDVFTADELKKAWPKEYPKLDIVEIDVVDDGEKLTKFKAGSLDFIIANHFIEHCLDPIGTIINMYKKLRNHGVLFMAIPDKRYTFDKKRPLTTYEHLLEEHKDPTKLKFLREHTEEYVRLGEKYKGSVADRAQSIIESSYRVHYHVWTQRQMTEMFTRLASDFKLDFEIEALIKNRHEIIYIIRKTPRNSLRKIRATR